MGEIKFFGKVDLNKEGNISSQMPAWSMKNQLEELEEEVARKERALERGDIPHDSIATTREDLKKEKKQLNAIKESKPKFSETEENKLWKMHKDLGNVIKPTLFTRSEMMKGTASPHEEMRRMKDPCISVPKEIAELCSDNGIKVSEEKNNFLVSRDGASHMWKLIGRYFGENTNIEALRKD